MAAVDFFDLVKQALPVDLHPAELVRIAPERWWKERPYLAAIYALRKCPRINWDAYRECNKDVKESGIDPCLHYIKHGIYEGRKLVSWHPFKEKKTPGRPLVSVLVANYNNDLYLEKCIQSAMTQTLKDIEIIIVDDCSTDCSRDVIQNLMKIDPRIRAIFNETNSGLVEVRRKGVEAATGRYIMFLDSDDYLDPSACETAAAAIEQGYDLVKFNASVINADNTLIPRAREIDGFLKSGNIGEYSREALIDSIFFKREIPWQIWTNIYLREICLRAYRELESGYFNHPEDAYAMVAITRHIRKAAKIDSSLYHYNIGSGISTTRNKAKLFAGLDNFISTCKAIRDYSRKNDIEKKYNVFLRNLCHDALVQLISSEAEDSASQLIKIADVFGIEVMMSDLIKNYGNQAKKIARLIPSIEKKDNVYNIGIFYPYRTPGGIERWVGDMGRALTETGQKVTIFCEFRTGQDLPLPKNVNILYLPPFGDTLESQMCRMRNLEKEAKRHKIGLMIHAGTRYPSMLWDLLLLQYSGIPVILAYHYDQAFRVLEKSTRGEEEDAVFRKASGVVCFSKAEEQRMRAQGIKASLVKRFTRPAPRIKHEEIPAKIAVMGRLGDPVKQVEENLKVMRCIVAKAPWVTMHFIGDFYTDEQRRGFERRVREFGLERNIRMYGWVPEPEKILSECGVFLSTIKWGVAPAGITEARALGLPVVMYELLNEIVADSEEVAVVKQGDYEGAAEKIMGLLEVV